MTDRLDREIAKVIDSIIGDCIVTANEYARVEDGLVKGIKELIDRECERRFRSRLLSDYEITAVLDKLETD